MPSQALSHPISHLHLRAINVGHRVLKGIPQLKGEVGLHLPTEVVRIAAKSSAAPSVRRGTVGEPLWTSVGPGLCSFSQTQNWMRKTTPSTCHPPRRCKNLNPRAGFRPTPQDLEGKKNADHWSLVSFSFSIHLWSLARPPPNRRTPAVKLVAPDPDSVAASGGDGLMVPMHVQPKGFDVCLAGLR